MREQFSVCMNVYYKDDPLWLQQAVNSVLCQSVCPDEIVLVVDGPIGEALNRVIQEYEESEIFKVVRLEQNRGLGIARQIGVSCCSHELVALMDADDINLPDRFEKQLAVFAREPELAVLGGQITEFVSDPASPVSMRCVPLTDLEIKQYLKTRCPMNHITVMFKKSAVEKAGGYLDWYCNEDYYLWNRMFLTGAVFMNLPDVLVNVRVGNDMYQRRGGRKYFSSEWKLQNYMWKHKIINVWTYGLNVLKRLIVQVLLPNRIRGWVFRHFARRNVTENENGKADK